ncbi:MAG TPA: hypothetical protein DEO60_03115 [Bacteroidales bacterium]|nr:hypothetical protein [Bacteroidales bacterium]HBZ20095.1 hypothetical protein [Bacteroidales bacterium]
MIKYWEKTIDEPSDKSMILTQNLFWIGFVIYIASYVISTSNQVNYVICNLLQVLGLVIFLPSAVILIQYKFDNSYLKVVFPVYCLWLITVMLRGVEFDYQTIKQLLFDPASGMFLYLVPFVLLIPVTPAFLKKLFFVIVILGMLYLLYDLIFIKQLLYPTENIRSQAITEYFTQHLSLPAGFVLLTFIYHKRKTNLLLLFTLIIAFLLAVIRARRGLMFMSFSILAFSLLFYQVSNKTKIGIIIISYFFIIIAGFIAIKVYENNRKDTFSLITQRIGQRTRTEVEQYFYRDLRPQDWIFGKGLNGQYYCPGVNEGSGTITIYRKVIETGYLQVVLNGGLISLILLLIIAVPAVIKGVFYSKNMLSRASGIWVFLFLLFMYPGTLTIFSLNYILVWISIGICYSKEFRKLSDEKISEMFAIESIKGKLS